MEENKIALIQVWIGKIPDYFWFHYETTKNIKGIDFFIFSDQKIQVDAKNYFVYYISKQDIERVLSSKLGEKIIIANEKKVCDLKASFGDIFEHFILDYQYFGCYDIDTLFGDFDLFVKPHLGKYDAISVGGEKFHNRLSGPFLILKNTKELRELYRSKEFIDCMNSEELFSFEEHYLTKIIFEKYKYKIITEVNLEEDNGGKNTYFVKWTGGKVFIKGEEKFLYHMYRKKTTLLKKVDRTIYGILNKNLLDDFIWVLGFTENYSSNIEYILDSMHFYSNRRCILYSINFNYRIPDKYTISDQFEIRRINIPEGKKDKVGRDENVISCKPLILLDVCDYLPDSKFVFIDSDVYLTPTSDDIVQNFDKYSYYPLINSHIHDRLYVADIIKNEKWTSTVDILANVCNVDICIFPRRKTNLILFDQKSKWFFQEQIDLYEKYKNTVDGIFGLHDEDSANVIISKYKLDDCLHLCDIEEVDDLSSDFFYIKDPSFHRSEISSYVKFPKHLNELYFFHGIKNKERYESIRNKYGNSVIDSEEFYVYFEKNCLVFEKNSFLTDKKIPKIVDFKLSKLNGELLFVLEKQEIYNYWSFYITNIDLEKNSYKLEIFGSNCKRKLYNDILEVY